MSDLDAMTATDHLGGAFVEALKPHTAVIGLGATLLNGLVKNVQMPRWLTGATVGWVGEDTAPTESDPTADNVQLNYHQLSSTFRASRQLIIQADPSIESTFRQDALRSIGVELDRAAINGSGTGAEPKGFLKMTGIGLPTRASSADGKALAWADIPALVATVEVENAIGRSFGFLTNSVTEAAMMRTERASGTARFILDDVTPDKLAGYPIAFSNNVPSNGTKGTGTNLSTLAFGNWADMLIRAFHGIDVIVDQFTESAKGNVRISLHSAFDIAVRYEESFACYKDVITV